MNNRKKRIEILNKIDILSGRCTCTTQEQRDVCDNCKKVAQLGEELNTVSYKERQAKSGRKVKVLTPQRKNNRDALIMTVDEYLAFKRKQMSDSQVAEIKGVSKSTVGYWKKKHAEHLIQKSG